MNILIYSKQNCPYCVRAKQFFKERDLAYREVDLSTDYAELDALKKRTGFMTLPQIFIDDQFIGGYTDLIAKVENGEIKDLRI